ncbi:hypothetical protein RJT34_31685 [Clitoria ternatea]|uniref:Uncharacterized protein n=1 Tax=Clitoria ternatea TaxID=43366 RepID=A0AAN9I329_CLITE
MVSSKKIIQIAMKWQKLATKQSKRIIWRKSSDEEKEAKAKAEKGHFVVYSTDEKRFVLPLWYLKNGILRELFKMAEEEFGVSSNVPLTLPCEGKAIEYLITLIQRNVAKDLEEAVLMSVATHRCQSYLDEPTNNQHFICTY